jgi:cell division protein FtsQ
MSVALGREQDKTTLKKRVDRLINIYPQLARLLPDGIQTVDMRYPNGLALSSAGLVPATESGKAGSKNAAVKSAAAKNAAVKKKPNSTSVKTKLR